MNISYTNLKNATQIVSCLTGPKVFFKLTIERPSTREDLSIYRVVFRWRI